MSGFRKFSSVLLSILLLGTILAACNVGGGNNAGKPKDGGTLTFGSTSDIVTLNPIYLNDTASGDASQFLMADLYNLNREGLVTAEPWSIAAEAPKISDDGLTYTVKMKDFAKWSDGTPITADDVIYTIDTMRNPDAGSPGISSFDKIETIKKINDYEFSVTLQDVYAPFIYSLALTPAPAHILKDVPVTELQQHPYGKDINATVTSGPWKWVEWNQTQHHVFQKDPNYWGKVKPHIEQVIYKIYDSQQTEVQALLRGDIDHVSAIPVTSNDVVKAEPSITFIQEPGASYEFISFNFDASNYPDNFNPFEGQKSRQAIAYALDRQGMIDNVLKGTGILMNAPFLPGTWADPGDRATNYEYNPDKAKKLLEEDGWKMNASTGYLEKNGKRFTFELQYNTGNSRREQVSQIIQANLKDVGIEVKPQGKDFSAWVEQNLNPGKYQAILLGWSLSNPDPDSESIFSSKYFPPDGQNMGWYKNEELDKLWVDGYKTTDQTARKEVYAKVGEIISQDLPYVFMYRYGNGIGIGPKVKWAEEDAPEPSLAYGYYFHVIKWWIEE